MQGYIIKKKLLSSGFVLAKIAIQMGESAQNLDMMLRSDNVKSETIERICKVINKTIDFFYSEKEYEYLIPSAEKDDMEKVSLKKYEEKVEECVRLRMELEAVKAAAARYAKKEEDVSITTTPALP